MEVTTHIEKRTDFRRTKLKDCAVWEIPRNTIKSATDFDCCAANTLDWIADSFSRTPNSNFDLSNTVYLFTLR